MRRIEISNEGSGEDGDRATRDSEGDGRKDSGEDGDRAMRDNGEDGDWAMRDSGEDERKDSGENGDWATRDSGEDRRDRGEDGDREVTYIPEVHLHWSSLTLSTWVCAACWRMWKTIER